MTVRKVAIPLATVILMAGCGASPAGEKAGEVDPQVLQDVISSTFMVPRLLAEDTQARSGALAETKPEAVECLRRRTGLEVEEGDPTTFLRSVNFEMSKRSTDRDDEMRYSEAYADCMAEYFEMMEEELLKKRPELVERNREVLERFASELSVAGYVP